MFARRLGSKGGFTLVETLIAVALLAMLMAAVGVAVHASAVNYKANENIFKAMNTARQAMTRITSDLRTALDILEGDPPNKCSIDYNGDGIADIVYRRNIADDTLYLDINSGGNAGSYVLCRNVTAMTFTRTPATGVVRNVQISMKVTVDGQSQRVASAAVIRRNM